MYLNAIFYSSFGIWNETDLLVVEMLPSSPVKGRGKSEHIPLLGQEALI